MNGRERRLFARELFVEVTRVCTSVLYVAHLAPKNLKAAQTKSTYNLGEVRRRNALVENIVEADVLEEGMALDLLGVGLSRTKTAQRVASQELQLMSMAVELIEDVVRTFCRMETASRGIVMGYNGSSSRMASKISSSSSPRNGD